MGIEFGPGTIYYLGVEGNPIPVGGITEMNFEELDDIPEVLPTPISSLTAEASFEALCKIGKEAYMILTGLRNDILKLCPNKRVVHLADHASKYKIRKKNFHRAIRILEGEEND